MSVMLHACDMIYFTTDLIIQQFTVSAVVFLKTFQLQTHNAA